MKVLHVITYDTGGAAKACLRLHLSLLELGIESKVLCRVKKTSFPEVVQFSPVLSKPNITKRLKRKLHRIGLELKLAKPPKNPYQYQSEFRKKRAKGLEIFTYPQTPYDITQSLEYREADIINLHWIAGFLDWNSFFLKNDKPIVWTFHDLNPILGGEHYRETFFGIDEAGKPITRKKSTEETEEEDKLVSYKKKCLKNVSNLIVVSYSKWVKEQAEQSDLFGRFDNRCIYLGIPTKTFIPHNKNHCKKILGIPEDKNVILFVSNFVEQSRKGYAYLKKAILELPSKYKEKVFLCVVGKKSGLEKEFSNILELGTITDEQLMAVIYSAADLFVIPSLEEAFGQTTVEAQLCGTPTIGFPTGGIKDAIQDGENGYLCADISIDSLKRSIQRFLDHPDVFDPNKVVAKARERHNSIKQSQKYVEIYKEILSTS